MSCSSVRHYLRMPSLPSRVQKELTVTKRRNVRHNTKTSSLLLQFPMKLSTRCQLPGDLQPSLT